MVSCRQLTTYRCDSKPNPDMHPCQPPGPFPPSPLQVFLHRWIVQGPWTQGPLLLPRIPSCCPPTLPAIQAPASQEAQLSSVRACLQHSPLSSSWLCLSLNKLILKSDSQCNVIEREWVQEVTRLLRDINTRLLEASFFCEDYIYYHRCLSSRSREYSFWFVLSVSIIYY